MMPANNFWTDAAGVLCPTCYQDAIDGAWRRGATARDAGLLIIGVAVDPCHVCGRRPWTAVSQMVVLVIVGFIVGAAVAAAIREILAWL